MDQVRALKELLEQRFDGQDETLKRIEAQTTATNGRVNRLETQMAIIWATVGIVATVIMAMGFLGMLKKPGEVVITPSAIIR